MTNHSRSPLVGISASAHDFGDYGAVGVQRPVHLAGGVPVTLAQIPATIDSVLDRLDGLVLAPGRDIEPSRYGQSPSSLLSATEPQRDSFELALVGPALDRGLPILGMCRGMQVLNVALGGTLLQDVRLRDAWREHPSDPGWRLWKEMESSSVAGARVPDHPRHTVAIASPSRLADALETTEVSVNSFHHQAVDRLGRGLRVTARAPDGVPEAIELDGAEVLAVQWELQEEWRVDARFTRVFEWFIGAARRYAAGRAELAIA